MSTKSLEEQLLDNVLQNLAKRKKQQVEYITENLLDREEYIQRVGVIRGIVEAEEAFKETHRTFFPDVNVK